MCVSGVRVGERIMCTVYKGLVQTNRPLLSKLIPS
jgi:hypothetical protein